MPSQIRISRTVLSTLVVAGALLVSSLSAPARASGPDPILTDGLEAIADEFGDLLGHIVGNDAAGSPATLAFDMGGYYQVYTAGDAVGLNDTLVFCYQDLAGGFSSCGEITPPGSTEYGCYANDKHTWCACEGLWDCFDMLETGICTESPVCTTNACTCEA